MNNLYLLIKELERISLIIKDSGDDFYVDYPKILYYKNYILYFEYLTLSCKIYLNQAIMDENNLITDRKTIFILTKEILISGKTGIKASEFESIKDMDDVQLALTHNRCMVVDDELIKVLKDFNE